jgi:hypothetical protein
MIFKDKTKEYHPTYITTLFIGNHFYVTVNEDKYDLDICQGIARKNDVVGDYQTLAKEVNEILSNRHKNCWRVS